MTSAQDLEVATLEGRVAALLTSLETSSTPAALAEAAALLALPTTLHCRPGGLAKSEGGFIVTPPALVLVTSQATSRCGRLGPEAGTRGLERNLEVPGFEEEPKPWAVHNLPALELAGRQVEVVDHCGPGNFVLKLASGASGRVTTARLLAGPGEGWDEAAAGDFARLVQGRLVRVGRVEGVMVELLLGDQGMSVAACLAFLGHTAPPTAATTRFQQEEQLGDIAEGCREQKFPSPDLILLTFHDHPETEKRILALSEALGGLQGAAAEELVAAEAPPGWVEAGSAVLAPWQVS